ncbi:MAG: sulfatase/phosphatase domain-containing protein, partial [Planctomycetota bacterium]
RKKFPDTTPEGVIDFERMVHAYWGTVLSVDDSVGRLVEFLKASGQYENTIIVFMGDNGLLEGEHGMVDKRTMHEASIRIPLIARGPGLPVGRTCTAQVLTLDLAPTILELCHVPALESVQGRSFRSVTSGEDPSWRDSWFYEYNYEKQFPFTPNIRGVRTDRWKFIRYPHGDGTPDRHPAEMYDLQEDPGELNNLAEIPAHTEQRKQLEAQLARLMMREGLTPATDRMPIDQGIGTELPDQKLR